MGFWDWLMGTPPQQRTMPAGRVTGKRDSVFGIRVGDVVRFEEVDYLVTNRVAYDEEGFTWQDYMLVDKATGDHVWLSVEEDDGLQLGVFHVVDLGLSMPPVPKTFQHDGVTYRQVERGNARVVLECEDVRRSNQSHVEFWDYEAPGERLLTITRWGDEYEAAAGRCIEAFEVRVYPATP